MDLQGRSHSFSQVYGVSNMASPYWFCGWEGSAKGRWPLLALMPDTSVSPCVPLVPFKLPPSAGAQREQVWVGKSICGLPKRNFLGFQQPPPVTQSLLVFTARSCGDLSSWHWNPGLGCLMWVWDSSLLRYPSWIFNHVDVRPACSVSLLLPPVWMDMVSSIL